MGDERVKGANLLLAHLARVPHAMNGVAVSYDIDGQAERLSERGANESKRMKRSTQSQ